MNTLPLYTVTQKVMKPYFMHPSCPDTKVYFIFDICHMLKLVRNTLAGRKVLEDGDGNQIAWYDIVNLHRMQTKEGLRLANKLNESNVTKWYKNKQKVTFAAQVLSQTIGMEAEFAMRLLDNDGKVMHIIDQSTIDVKQVSGRITRHDLGTSVKLCSEEICRVAQLLGYAASLHSVAYSNSEGRPSLAIHVRRNNGGADSVEWNIGQYNAFFKGAFAVMKAQFNAHGVFSFGYVYKRGNSVSDIIEPLDFTRPLIPMVVDRPMKLSTPLTTNVNANVAIEPRCWYMDAYDKVCYRQDIAAAYGLLIADAICQATYTLHPTQFLVNTREIRDTRHIINGELRLLINYGADIKSNADYEKMTKDDGIIKQVITKDGFMTSIMSDMIHGFGAKMLSLKSTINPSPHYFFAIIKCPYKKTNCYHSVIKSERKVGFQGFLVSIESITCLFNDLVRNGDLDYLCTYKLSQDHLESFFGWIRQRRGCGNNPTVIQFQGSYKRLLMGSQIKVSKSANIMPQEAVKLTTVTIPSLFHSGHLPQLYVCRVDGAGIPGDKPWLRTYQ
ncbi:hypothetical protein FOCC_FOCC007475, partial [Frankliniella occidentalis]